MSQNFEGEVWKKKGFTSFVESEQKKKLSSLEKTSMRWVRVWAIEIYDTWICVSPWYYETETWDTQHIFVKKKKDNIFIANQSKN